jgi:uncharacterized protein YeaO (DUF488 family)
VGTKEEEEMAEKIRLKRVYEAPAKADGTRVLVDRLWPRGLSKAEAKVDVWLRDVAPSAPLRKWFGHKPERFGEFAKRYRVELKDNPALDQLRDLARHEVTLVYGAKDETHNQARVLAEVLED